MLTVTTAFRCLLFSQEASIVDVQLGSKYASDIRLAGKLIISFLS